MKITIAVNRVMVITMRIMVSRILLMIIMIISNDYDDNSDPIDKGDDKDNDITITITVNILITLKKYIQYFLSRERQTTYRHSP